MSEGPDSRDWSSSRIRARQLWAEHAARGDHFGWFEALYRGAFATRLGIPWADFSPNPHLRDWHERSGFHVDGTRCLVVGCGLGDDAEYLAGAGGLVTAFDIAPTALRWCRRRFPDTRVRYIEADLLAGPGEWTGSFDFVFEAYTLQVMPPGLRPAALGSLARFLSAAGTLLLVCRGRDAADPPGDMPWPLTREELEPREIGLPLMSFEDYHDAETPPVRRFRAVYRRV